MNVAAGWLVGKRTVVWQGRADVPRSKQLQCKARAHVLLLVMLGVAAITKKEPTPCTSILPKDVASVAALLAKLRGGIVTRGVEKVVGGGGPHAVADAGRCRRHANEAYCV